MSFHFRICLRIISFPIYIQPDTYNPQASSTPSNQRQSVTSTYNPVGSSKGRNKPRLENHESSAESSIKESDDSYNNKVS